MIGEIHGGTRRQGAGIAAPTGARERAAARRTIATRAAGGADGAVRAAPGWLGLPARRLRPDGHLPGAPVGSISTGGAR